MHVCIQDWIAAGEHDRSSIILNEPLRQPTWAQRPILEAKLQLKKFSQRCKTRGTQSSLFGLLFALIAGVLNFRRDPKHSESHRELLQSYFGASSDFISLTASACAEIDGCKKFCPIDCCKLEIECLSRTGKRRQTENMQLFRPGNLAPDWLGNLKIPSKTTCAVSWAISFAKSPAGDA